MSDHNVHEVAARWRADQAKSRAVIKALVEALTRIKGLKPETIGDTGFETGPQALLNAAQRIAKEALSRAKELGDELVCERHPTVSWNDCKCGAPGMPCPDCIGAPNV